MTTAMAAIRRVRLLLPLVVELPPTIVEVEVEGAMLSSASSKY
jgi:hypothetical protein